MCYERLGYDHSGNRYFGTGFQPGFLSSQKARDNYVVSDSLIESILTLAIGLYIGSKVLQSKNLPTNAECKEAKNITTLAALREEEIEEQRRLAHERNIINKEEKETTEDASNYTFDIPVQETTTEFNFDE